MTAQPAAAMVNTMFRIMDKVQSASPAPDATLLAIDLAWLPKKNTSNTTIEMVPNTGASIRFWHRLLREEEAGDRTFGCKNQTKYPWNIPPRVVVPRNVLVS
jgi:hypothetical protein